MSGGIFDFDNGQSCWWILTFRRNIPVSAIFRAQGLGPSLTMIFSKKSTFFNKPIEHSYPEDHKLIALKIENMEKLQKLLRKYKVKALSYSKM
jgi:hypothetical protein